MTLPTNIQLTELSKQIVEEGKNLKGEWYTYNGMKQSLDRSGGDLIVSAASAGVKAGVNALAVSGGVATGVAFIPFAVVLTPWIAAASIVQQSGTIFELYDILEAYERGTVGSYNCKCGKCVGNIKYVIEKKEINTAKIAIGVATVGVSAIFTTINSIRKSFQTGRPKEMTSRGLVESARAGCTIAIATIFLLSGRWEAMRGGNEETMRRAIAIITSEDGWSQLKSEW